MLKDITLGQYFPGNSVIHRLDPRTKLIVLVVYMVTLFVASGWVSYGVLLLFLLAVILAPVAGIVPSAATAPALIIVGVFMMKGVLKIDWSDMETAIPCFLTIAMMPFAYSIADGIGFGIISYTLIKLARGKAKEVPVLMYILSVLFILSYVLLATTAA